MTLRKLDQIYDAIPGKNWDDDMKAGMKKHTDAVEQYLKENGWKTENMFGEMICPVCGENFAGAPGWAISHNEEHVQNHEAGQLMLFKGGGE